MLDVAAPQPSETLDRSLAANRYRMVRAASEALAAPLSPEDQSIQSMPDVSPTKWHLAHVSWFFETFLLRRFDPDYRPFDPAFAYLFNSYYEAAGPRHPRPQRGLLSRPGVAEVLAYRAHVDQAMTVLIARLGANVWDEAARLVELGLHHEQQHQELLLMDIKHVLSVNPLLPAYHPHPDPPPLAGEGAIVNPPPQAGEGRVGALRWIDFPGGLQEIGHAGSGFAFDNETPRHKVWVEPFRLASRAVTCAEWLEFIADDGYRRPEFWLSDGWATVCQEEWRAPFYWRKGEAGWSIFTLAGERRLDPAEPVCHVSFYEADAFAKWQGRRLPTEAEWEIAARDLPVAGNFADRGCYHPEAACGDGLAQMFGDVWEWTASPYTPYPRFRAGPGAVGEYNGKFMCNQIVLRGGAAVTPPGHLRATYRNFFAPAARWPFTGLRLAEDL